MPVLSHFLGLFEDSEALQVGPALLAWTAPPRPSARHLATSLLQALGAQEPLARRHAALQVRDATSFGFLDQKCCCNGKGYLVKKAKGVTDCTSPASPLYHLHPESHQGKNCKCGTSALNAPEIRGKAETDVNDFIQSKWEDIQKKLATVSDTYKVEFHKLEMPTAKFSKFSPDFLCCCASKGACSMSRTCLNGHLVAEQGVCKQADADGGDDDK